MSGNTVRYYDVAGDPTGGLLWATGQGGGSIVARALVRSLNKTGQSESVSEGDVVYLLPAYDTTYSDRGFFSCSKSFPRPTPDRTDYGAVILGVVKFREMIKDEDTGEYNTWVDVIIRGEAEAYCVATTTADGTGGTFSVGAPLGAYFDSSLAPTNEFRGVLAKLHSNASGRIPQATVGVALASLTTTTGTTLGGRVKKKVWIDGLYKTPLDSSSVSL